MSVFPNVQNLAMNGCTVNVVSGDQISVTQSTSAPEHTVGGTRHSIDIPLPAKKALPRLSPMFTGRKDMLEKLTRFFDRSQGSIALRKQRIFVLFGLGGSGKTQIMLKFVDMSFDQFSDLHYIDASTLATLQSSLEDIARNVAAGKTAEDALRWLSNEQKEWLLLIDNADDPNINLRRFFPHCQHGNIIVTSRNKDCRLHAPNSNCCVTGMEPHDATELLLNYAMVEQSEQNRFMCAAIVRELGYLALAIAQAGAYIAQCSCLDDYLQIFQDDRAELLHRHSVQTTDDYEWTVYTTWEISLKRLSPATTMLLRICAFMHYDGISKMIFKRAAAAAASETPGASFQHGTHFLRNFTSEDGKWSETRFLDHIKALTSYSLIDVNAEAKSYSIHPLVHAWARDRVCGAESEEARACAIQLLALSTPCIFGVDDFILNRTLRPHVDQALAGIEDTVDPEVAYRLHTIYSEAGHWSMTEKLVKPIVDKWTNELGENHQATLSSLTVLSRNYRFQGRWKEAEVLQVKIMEARSKLLGNEHPITLGCMSDLAATYCEQEKWKEAEALEERATEVKRRVLGDEHPITIASMTRLASLYRQQGRWNEAETMETKVLDVRRRELGDQHPDTLVRMAHLAATYCQQGRWDEAMELQLKVMETTKRLLGDEHPYTLSSMAHLANTHIHQGQEKMAEALLLVVVDARKRLLGDEHPKTLSSMAKLADTYNHQGLLEKAKALHVVVLETRRRIFGDSHSHVTASKAHLADIYCQQDQLNKAEALYMETIDTQRRQLGDEHPDTLRDMHSLAALYFRLGRVPEAKELQTRVVEASGRVLGDSHPDTSSRVAALSKYVNLAET